MSLPALGDAMQYQSNQYSPNTAAVAPEHPVSIPAWQRRGQETGVLRWGCRVGHIWHPGHLGLPPLDILFPRDQAALFLWQDNSRAATDLCISVLSIFLHSLQGKLRERPRNPSVLQDHSWRCNHLQLKNNSFKLPQPQAPFSLEMICN